MRRPNEYVRLLANAVDAKGAYFPGHSDGVTYLVRLMGSEAGFDEPMLDRLQIAAMLHDVGKLMIPTEYLVKPGRLTEGEWWTMRQHSAWGAMLCERIAGAEFASSWVLLHHEHFDGGGYPTGLRGESIPFEARIIHVADAFHVMTSNRPYKDPMTRSEALGEILSLSGQQFCPHAAALLAGRQEQVIDSWIPHGVEHPDPPDLEHESAEAAGPVYEDTAPEPIHGSSEASTDTERDESARQ